MKKALTVLQNNTAATTGQLILFFYKAYTAIFRRQDDFAPPPAPISKREIILVRKTGDGHRAIANITLSLS